MPVDPRAERPARQYPALVAVPAQERLSMEMFP